MSVTLETLAAELAGLRADVRTLLGRTPVDEAGKPFVVLNADDIDAFGGWQPDWLELLADRVAAVGNPNDPRLDGFAGAVVSVVSLGSSRESLRAIQVPRAIYSVSVIDAANEADITLTDKQAGDIRRNQGQADGLMNFVSVVPIAWRYPVFWPERVPGGVTMFGALKKRTLADIKAEVIAWVETQAAQAGVKLDLSGV